MRAFPSAKDLQAPLLDDVAVPVAAPAGDADLRGEALLRELDALPEPPPVQRKRRVYKPLGIAFSLAACLVVSLIPLWKETEPAQRAAAKRGLALFVLAATLYGTEGLPAWVTSLLMFPLSTSIELPPKSDVGFFATDSSSHEMASKRAQFNLDGLANQARARAQSGRLAHQPS